jgi:hypothetical protein
MREGKPTVVVDFNGVVRDYVSLAPIEGAKEAIGELRRFFQVAIWTRETQEAENWLEENGIEVDIITKEKPSNIVAVIDDRAVEFTSWAEILPGVFRRGKKL